MDSSIEGLIGQALSAVVDRVSPDGTIPVSVPTPHRFDALAAAAR